MELRRFRAPTLLAGHRVTAGVVIIIIIIVARLIGVTRAVELLMSNEGAQVVEADVTGAAVARSTLAAVQTFVG